MLLYATRPMIQSIKMAHWYLKWFTIRYLGFDCRKALLSYIWGRIKDMFTLIMSHHKHDTKLINSVLTLSLINSQKLNKAQAENWALCRIWMVIMMMKVNLNKLRTRRKRIGAHPDPPTTQHKPCASKYLLSSNNNMWTNNIINQIIRYNLASRPMNTPSQMELPGLDKYQSTYMPTDNTTQQAPVCMCQLWQYYIDRWP